ncbi:hypothetical protein NDU88_004681 [Pleurodeles waltl]|uniref:Uncharacterized protein n=1 Tax=Pleurodeles waltl TaxID=8319 RepID=A0AAV7RGW6_PLEWA|nr:hypothetical protein NDU88_004681 [Pleurodeles waltl]
MCCAAGRCGASWPNAGEAAAAHGRAAGEAAVRVKGCGARVALFSGCALLSERSGPGDPKLGRGSRCARRM